MRREMAHEENEQCRLMQEDYLNFVQQVGSREAVTPVSYTHLDVYKRQGESHANLSITN